MKEKLANSPKGFKCDTGKPSTRFYLGYDRNVAHARKIAIVQLWEGLGVEKWTAEGLTIAKALARGEQIEAPQLQDEPDEKYRERLDRVGSLVPAGTEIRGTTTLDDMLAAQNKRIASLEALIREKLGGGAVEGPTVSIHAALDAWQTYRMATELDPNTGKPTEHVRTQGNNVAFVKRSIADMPLSALNFIALQTWCKTIANRPLSLKSGKQIKPLTARNCLKVIRQFCKWASQNYAWTKPTDWHDATLTLIRKTREDRREQLSALSAHYSPEEIGTLWRYALPSERMLILLGLNFGYAQQEILDMQPQDVAGETVSAIRGKSGVIGKWSVWPETRELALTEFATLPKRRQHIANRWGKLLDRVCKDNPDFKRLSFKWLRKSGASLIRKLASGEIASTYLSHGESAGTADELLTVYADTDWSSVCSALDKLREQLLPHLSAEGVSTRTYIPLSKIEAIRAGWEAEKVTSTFT